MCLLTIGERIANIALICRSNEQNPMGDDQRDARLIVGQIFSVQRNEMTRLRENEGD